MFTKWIIDIKGMQDYRFAENGDLYRMPFTDANKKSRSVRKIKMQSKNRWVINGVWWSKTQLRPHLELDKKPIEITKINDLPF